MTNNKTEYPLTYIDVLHSNCRSDIKTLVDVRGLESVCLSYFTARDRLFMGPTDSKGVIVRPAALFPSEFSMQLQDLIELQDKLVQGSLVYQNVVKRRRTVKSSSSGALYIYISSSSSSSSILCHYLFDWSLALS